AAQRREQPGHGQQRGRLAGTVRAEQRDDLALLHRQVEVAHDRDPTVAGAQPPHLEQAAHGPSPPGSDTPPPTPRYACRTSGERCTSDGEPSAMTAPSSSTTTRSHTSSTRPMSWSTRRIEVPPSTMRRSCAPSRLDSALSSPAAGS